jgi:dipeptidyl aminopeptidase/acylaminoacyl peptidase
MIDERDLLERALQRFEPQPGLTDRVYRRRERRRRNQRIGAGALAIILALVSFVALTRAFRSAERPADEPTPRPQGILSPDGAHIAYFKGMGDWGNILWVMNADGSGVRVLIDEEFGHVADLAWSPDGSRLAFDARYGGGVWIVGVDGSGLTEVPKGSAPRWSPTGSRLAFQSAGGIWVINADGSGRREVAAVGRDPVWSPDGSRIAYQAHAGLLYVADLDGTHVRTLGTLEPPRRPTPVVVPLPLSASGEEQPTATVGGSGAAPFVYGIAVLGAVGVLVIAWRARRRTDAT